MDADSMARPDGAAQADQVAAAAGLPGSADWPTLRPDIKGRSGTGNEADAATAQ
jgi:hypothetical protein